MMKTKRFLLVAALAAVALTFSACSDDSSDNGGNALGACYMENSSGSDILCIEYLKHSSNLSIEDGKEDCEEDGDGVWQAKCPSGSDKVCKNITIEAKEGGTATINLYLYGALAAYSCEMLENELQD